MQNAEIQAAYKFSAHSRCDCTHTQLKRTEISSRKILKIKTTKRQQENTKLQVSTHETWAACIGKRYLYTDWYLISYTCSIHGTLGVWLM